MQAPPSRMIGVAALERRPLMRLALEGLIDGQPDLAAVGFAADRHGLARREVAARLSAMLWRVAPA